MPNQMPNKFTLVLDSSQLTTYLECPALWNYKYNRRLIPASFSEDEQEAMNAGTYGHKLLDIYYRNRSLGYSMNDAVELAFIYNPDNDTCSCGCSKDLHTTIEILSLDECTRCKKCVKFVPKPFPLSQDVRFIVRNRFREYCAKYMMNDFKPVSPQHVEVGFSESIFEDDENLFVLEGRIDLLATYQGLPCFVDHKFQMSTHWLYKDSIQFKNYALVTKTPMAVINYVRLHKQINNDSMVRDIINFSIPQLISWKSKLAKIFFEIKGSLVAGAFENRWSACSGYHGKTFQRNKPRYCWYGQLCESENEEMRKRREKLLFNISETAWKPW